MGPRLFVSGGFDPLAAGRAAARARALLRQACAGGRLGVATSGDEAPELVAAWRARAAASRLEFRTIDLAGPGAMAGLDAIDLLHVPAGHTAHLLHLLRPHAARLRAAWQAGLALSGTSGGGTCFATRLWSASRFGEPEWLEGLGFVPLALCPHFDQRPWAHPRLPVDAAPGLEVVALDDDALLDWTPDRAAFVALRPGARGHSLWAGGAPRALPGRDLSRAWAWLIRARRALVGDSLRGR